MNDWFFLINFHIGIIRGESRTKCWNKKRSLKIMTKVFSNGEWVIECPPWLNEFTFLFDYRILYNYFQFRIFACQNLSFSEKSFWKYKYQRCLSNSAFWLCKNICCLSLLKILLSWKYEKYFCCIAFILLL